MPYERYALVLDDDAGSLEEIALRLVRIGVDAVYAKDPDEAALLAHQESRRVGALLLPATTPVEAIPDAMKRVGVPAAVGPRAVVLIGRRPGDGELARLGELGVAWGLWEPFGDTGLRFVVTAALAAEDPNDPRHNIRVPTSLCAVVYKGSQQRAVSVENLSRGGAYLATPQPFLVGSQISLELPLPQGQLLLKAQLAHVRNALEPERADIPPGMGVAFREAPPEAEAVLARYVEAEVRKYAIGHRESPE